jgi:hypothetical protein
MDHKKGKKRRYHGFYAKIPPKTKNFSKKPKIHEFFKKNSKNPLTNKLG